MPKFVTIGYGDREGYDRTDPAIRDMAHAHDAQLRKSGILMGIAGTPVQVRNTDAKKVETTIGPFMSLANMVRTAKSGLSAKPFLGFKMYKKTALAWPSGDCKAIIATLLSPAQLAAATGALVFRDRDDLDWFEGASFQIEGLGTVLIMKHENNPLGLTALYVDLSCDANAAGKSLTEYFGLSPQSIAWQS